MSTYRNVYENLKELNQFVATTEDDTILNGCTVRYIKENKPAPGLIGSGNDEGITLTWA